MEEPMNTYIIVIEGVGRRKRYAHTVHEAVDKLYTEYQDRQPDRLKYRPRRLCLISPAKKLKMAGKRIG